MKRDLDLIRKLLIYFDEKAGPEVDQNPVISDYDETQIKYHLVLLHDAGYLRCEPVISSTSERVIYVLPFDLTWAGHEFLDKIRNEFVWQEVMDDIHRHGFVSASTDFVKKLADAVIRKKLNLSK